MDPYIGELRLMGFNFAPRGWATCDGQVLSISQYTALFSILGTTYRGNGTTNFQLPDLPAMVPIAQGARPGLRPIGLGQPGGETTHALMQGEMPAHSHPLTRLRVHSTNFTPVAAS